MGIRVKAIERNVSFDKNQEKWAYVLQASLYNRLSATKVIEEASVRSGIHKSVLNVSWAAIGEVIKAWATEGHTVEVPGLGSMRFGLRSASVSDVAKVSSDLISSRRVIFFPNSEIKDQLAKTSVSITCYDRNGKLVKQVNSSDHDDVENGDSTGDGDNTGGGGSGSTTGGGAGADTGIGGDDN